jgi:hypothetical protein
MQKDKDIEESGGNQTVLRTFAVNITETLRLTVEIQAETGEEAKQIANDRWLKGDWVLDAENFTGVEFEIASSD